MNRILYAGGIALCQIIVIVLSLISYLREIASSYELSLFLLVVTVIALLTGIFLTLKLVYRMWEAIQDEETRITPGLAVGLLFVPLVNVVWLFFVFPGYAAAYNDYVARHDLDSAPRLSTALQVFFVLLTIVPIPFVQWVVTYVAVGRLVDSVNSARA